MEPVDVYDFARPVRDPALFVGRQEIKQEVLDGVRRGASFAIIGGTRIGKTSLLFQVRQALLDQPKGPQNTVIGPVFLSTHEFPRLSQSVIYRRIVEEFRTTLAIPGDDEAWRQGVPLFDQHLKEDDAFDAFRQALDTIFQSRDVVRRIVIMIDEVDELRRYEWSHSFFNNLRHLISQTTAGERIAIIISGTLAIRSLYEVAGSPFLNVIQGTKSLELLSREETEQLVGRPTNYRLKPSVVADIYFETGGHPFLIQYVMRYLCAQFGNDLDRATERDVIIIVERYFSERTDFENWVTDFTDAERQAYHLVASSPQGASRAELVRAIGDPKRVNHAIRMLTHIGVIREERPNSNRYLVGGDMFRRWFYDTFDMTTARTNRDGETLLAAPTTQTGPTVRFVRLFVASANDVESERNAIRPIVDELNETLGRRLSCKLDLIKGRTDSPSVDVAECDVVIGIFWRRFDAFGSLGHLGATHAIERAREASERRGKPSIMVFFSDQPSTTRSLEDIEQLRKLVEFRDGLAQRGLCVTHESLQHFSDLVRKYLITFLEERGAAAAPSGSGV